ncbi:hypothetical protein ACO2Q3_24125 [Caulobacter sp. KR2-114]|uniref:hypothetical protein n=1 Tax=Caulobacter sp. KR2-114 TaxID=3400912 RepID=UPI003BFF0240
MLIFLTAVVVVLAVTLVLGLGPASQSRAWSATVTPLASIIGSGFLICGPLLAHEFGGAASLAMAALLALAYALGAVLRFNIAHLEPLLAKAVFHDRLAWAARASQMVLAIAYSISVAYYLKLLAEFALKEVALTPQAHALVAKGVVTLLILAFAAIAARGGHRRMEQLAHMTVSLKIGVIAGMLTALALYWLLRWDASAVVPPAKFSIGSIGLVLGLLVTVQGFETSRYLGHSYEAPLRIRTMRYAQWLSSAIYMAFVMLLTPFLAAAGQVKGVAGILDIMNLAAPLMGIVVLVGALASQLSAAVADSIGAAGIAAEVTRGRLGVRAGFLASGALSIAVVWLTNPFLVVAVASRAFAIFYAAQCGLAMIVARRTKVGGLAAQGAFAVLALVSLVAAMAGAPAEG